jgi:adenylate cyclase
VGYDSAAEPWLRLGVGLDVGRAFVGNVGSGDVKDFTAIGDVVNTAARLQSAAASGEILLSTRVRDFALGGLAGAELRTLELKGKSDDEEVLALTPTPSPAASGSAGRS